MLRMRAIIPWAYHVASNYNCNIDVKCKQIMATSRTLMRNDHASKGIKRVPKKPIDGKLASSLTIRTLSPNSSRSVPEVSIFPTTHG